MRPEADPYRVPDARCPGLAVRVARNGALTFDLAFRIKGGGARRLSLGRWPEVTLDEARDRANELTKAARAGRDLVAEQQAAKIEADARLSVAVLIERYLHRAVLGKLKTEKEIGNRLRRALASRLSTPAEEIKRRELRELFDAVADAGLTREAEKRRQTVGAMFRWAVSADLVDSDPTAGLAAYDGGTPRDRTLTEQELAALWEWLGAPDMPSDHADVLRLQIALGARCGEIAGMTAAEVNLAAAYWSLPPARSKNGKARITPLVGIARDILERRSARSGALFTSETGKPLTSSHVGQTLLNRRKRLPIAPFATHDLRRTFATALDGLGVAHELIADILGHDQAASAAVRTLVRHYVRADRLAAKRAALERWDQRLRQIIAGETAPANVAHLGRPA